MLREAIDNRVVYMLLRYYLVSFSGALHFEQILITILFAKPTSNEFAELCGVTDRTAIAVRTLVSGSLDAHS